MELSIFLKMMLDSALFITIASFMLGLFLPVTQLTGIMFFMAAAAAGCFLARNKNGIFRLAPLAIALPSFLFAEATSDYIVVALNFVYLLYITLKQIWLNDEGDFKDAFQKEFTVSLFPCFFSLIAYDFEMVSILVPNVFIMGLCGVALMRTLRHSREVMDSRDFKVSNLLSIAVVCLIAAFFSSSLFLGTIKSAFSFVYNGVVFKLLVGFIYAFTSFLSLFSKLFAMIFNKEVKFYENGDDGDIGGIDELEYDEVLRAEIPPVVIWITLAIVIAIAAFLIIKGFKSMGGRNRRFDNTTPFEMSRETIEIVREPKRNIFKKRTERESVRHQYRKFLQECLQRGFMITPDFDTRQIADGAREHFPGAPLEAFRNLYIKARYTDEEISKSEADEAKDLYSEIKKTSVMDVQEKGE